MAESYTLYIHSPETEVDIDDDLYEPAAFQIPVHMQWKDLQDLICNEVRCDRDLTFKYLDDEGDRVTIGSQAEYMIAMNLARKCAKDLHIYATVPRGSTVTLRNRVREKKRQEDAQSVNPYQAKDEEVEILRPPVDSDENTENQDNEPENPRSLSELGASAPLLDPPTQEDVVTSTEEETKPMPVANPISALIRKEVQEVIDRELDELWNYINDFKKDVNERLDAIGDQLVGDSQEEDEEMKEEDGDLQRSPPVPEVIPEEEAKEDNFAASFVCENLLDGSEVHAGETFEKYWVFKNEGTSKWNESTKLHLLEENCNPPANSEGSLSEWGPKQKSVVMPALSKGQSSVICVEHVAPRHNCDYTSSWKLSHDSNPFGPRVWCNVSVIDESPVKSLSHGSTPRSFESFEELAHPTSGAEEMIESDGAPLVPPQKIKIDDPTRSPAKDGAEFNDNSILSFNMDDVGDGAHYLPQASHESVPFNPAVSTVMQQNEEVAKESDVDQEKDQSSVDEPSAVAETVEIPELMSIDENQASLEEPKTLEAEEKDEDVVEDHTQVEELQRKQEETVEQGQETENFTEQEVITPDHESSDGTTSLDEAEEEAVEPEETQERRSSDDLHSVDFNLDDNASMTSYDVSDFVVVPLPECFDVNRPLCFDTEEKTDRQPSVDAATSTSTPPTPPPQENQDEIASDEDSEEEEEVDSQPNSQLQMEAGQEDQTEDDPPVNPPVNPDPDTTTITPEPAPKESSPTMESTPAPLGDLAPVISSPEVPKSYPQETPTTANDLNQPPQNFSFLNNAIHNNFEAFTTHPSNPPPPATKPKVPMNQIPVSISKPPKFIPQPKPVPQSVLDLDKPYPVQRDEDVIHFPPFDQGWRRNPLPLPTSVTDDRPWQPQTSLPQSEYTLNRNSNGIESTLPKQPFAVAPSFPSFGSDFNINAGQHGEQDNIPLPDDFFPPSLAQDPDEVYRTPPPSPPPFVRRDPSIQPSALDQLYEMGFHNMELNQEMFTKCDQDINRTVQALVLRMEADGNMS